MSAGPVYAEPVSITTAIIVGASAFAAEATIFGLSVAASAAILGATSLALSFASQKLAPGPSKVDLGAFGERAIGQQISVRDPTASWKLVYGEKRVSGPIPWAATAPDPDNPQSGENAMLHWIVVLAAHEVEEIGTVFIDDKPVYADMLDGDGQVTGSKEWADDIFRIKKITGASDQAADSDTVTEVEEWTTDHRLRGHAYLIIRQKFSISTKARPNITAVVRGKKILDTRDDTTRYSDNPALVLRDYLATTRHAGGAGATSAEIDDDYVDAAANECDEFVDTEDVAQAASSVDTTDDIIYLAGDELLFLRGDRVQVTTTDTLPSGISAATDYYVIPYQERRVDAGNDPNGTAKSAWPCAIKLASSFANALAGTPIDITSAGAGDHTVTKNGEPRYTAAGIVDTEQEPGANINEILTAMAGHSPYIGGQYRISAGAYSASGVTLDESHLRAAIEVVTKLEGDKRVNAIKGVYATPLTDGQPADYPAVTNAVYEAEDGDQRDWGELDLPFTPRVAMAQRLAKIELERSRRQITARLPCNLAAFQLQAGTVFAIDNTRMGWSGKTFKVQEWSALAEPDPVGGAPRLGVDLEVQEEDANVYAWSSSEEQPLDAAPRTNLANPFVVLPPTGLTVASGDDELFVAGDGTVQTAMRISWTAPEDVFVRWFEVGWKRPAATNYTTVQLGQDITEHIVAPVRDGDIYDVRVRAVNYLLSPSPFETTQHTVEGKDAVPSDVDTFNVANLADGTRRFDWTHADPPADVRVGGGYQIRYASGSSLTWSSGTILNPTGLLRTSPYETNQLAGGTYTFGIKAVDSSGNESANDVQQTVTLADPPLSNALLQRIEQNLGWPGTKTDCFVNYEGFLEADADGEGWDDLGNWEDLDAWFEIHTKVSPIEYTTPILDLGGNVSFNPVVTAQSNGSATITMATGADGDSPQVGSFGALAPVTSKRYIQIKVSIAATSPLMTGLEIVLDGAILEDEFQDVDISSEASSWFEKSPELVQNGGFDADTAWTKGTGWSIASGVAHKSPGTGSNLNQNNVVAPSGKAGLYEGSVVTVTFTISNYVAGTVTPSVPSNNGTARSADGQYTEDITVPASAHEFRFIADSSFEGDIDDVSVVWKYGHFKVENRKSMAAITQASLVLQSVGPGWTYELRDKATTLDGGSEVAAEFIVFDNGVMNDAVVDIMLRGPEG